MMVVLEVVSFRITKEMATAMTKTSEGYDNVGLG